MTENTDSQKKSNDVGVLKQLMPYLLPYKLQLSVALIALLMTSGLTLLLGQGVRYMIDNGFIAGSLDQLNFALALMAVLIIFMACATFTRFYLVTWLGERVAADLRKAVFNRIVHLHPAYFEENRSGEIMSRLTTDSTLLQSIIGSSISFALRSAIMMAGGLVMLFITNSKLSLIVLIAVPLVLIPARVFGKKVRSLSKKSQESVADVGTYAGEIIQQIKTVQSYARESLEKQAFANEAEKAFNIAKQRILNRSILTSSVILMAFLAIGCMIWVGGYDVIHGKMSGGELAAFIFYAMLVASGVASVAEVWGEVQRAAGATERLLELLNQPGLINTPKNPLTADKSLDTVIAFNDVCFFYPSRPDKAAIDHINLSVKRGETLAVVGASGAGKSTLFELLLRFYDVNSGDISINGKNIIHQDLTHLRSQMALVPQQPTLFSSDVWHNIRYGNPNAKDNEVYAAANAAYADEFIDKLPEGYTSFLGENGVRLSGGQKQRIIIARAILNNPEILLLDEATSALDAQSEHQVQKALEHLMQHRTTLIIAHRLSTVRNADRIVLMEQGKISDIGTHNELISRSALYQRLCELQFGESSEPQH
jgi:ATP-binding cassette, subfamily B, bacterial